MKITITKEISNVLPNFNVHAFTMDVKWKIVQLLMIKLMS